MNYAEKFPHLSIVSLVVALVFPTLGHAQTAPGVTGLLCSNQNGQTFCTYSEPSTDPNWTSYRYNLYESTAGPITDLGAATLVESGLLSNGGYLNNTAAYTQANRTRSSAIMATTTDLGPMVPNGTGIAVRTTPTNRAAYYAVITVDTRGILSPSPVMPGTNSLSTSVAETTAPIQPVLQLASTDTRTKTPKAEQIPANSSGLPMWFFLHGSGGNMPQTGDYWAFWGDSTMGIHDGVQQVGKVYYTALTYGQPTLYAAPQDRVWFDTGLRSLETYWDGFDWLGDVQPYTQHWLNTFLPYLVSHYKADPNRIYGYGKSMGGLGQTYWGLWQSAQPFAAVFAEVPIWWIEGNVTSMTQHRTILTKTELIAGTDMTYYSDQNSPVGVADCNNAVPPTIWANGRNDTSFANHSMWSNAVVAANAMKACHRAFAFGWNSGNHSEGGLPETAIRKQYQTIYARNVSYPVFTNFSLDSDYGNGDYTAGECASGTSSPLCYVNFGWSWTIVTDSSSTWSVTFSNSQLTTGSCPTLHCSATATVDVTAGNPQSFRPPTGAAISWSASSGQNGITTVDQYGLVTVVGANVGLAPLTLMLNYSNP
jgi:hypothetical protein